MKRNRADCAARFAALRRLTIIGRPPFGRNVTFSTGHTAWPGASSSLKFRMIAATTIVASWMAKVAPMQMRGPAPNGR